MNDIPCFNCITLGICKAEYKTHKDIMLLMNLRVKMETKCCILKNWMLDDNTIHSDKCSRFHTFFNPRYEMRFYE
jgi:hypothetical protein